MKVQYLHSFFFETATHIISDEYGQSAQLMVNYKEGEYQIETKGKVSAQALDEIATIASDLLKRKRGKNIAER